MSAAAVPMPSPLPSLAGASWLSDPRLAKVVAALERGGGEARIVGGAVRQALVGRPVHEVDVATTVTPDQTIALSEAAGLKAVPTGIDHGTITVIADGAPYEVTTLRRDVETDGRRAVVAYTTDWAEDAARRDFTMNALYAALDGTLFDPLGGYRDTVARHVRFIGDPHDRIREDYLRILRLFRFHAELGRGAIDAPGLAAAAELRAGLATLSRERVRQELLRLLAARGAGAVVPAMVRAGIFDALALSPVALDRFERLIAIERALGRTGDHLLRLAALLWNPHDQASPSNLGPLLRLSRAEAGRLKAACVDQEIAAGWTDRQARHLVFRAGNAAAVDRTVLAWAGDRDAAPDDTRWRALCDVMSTWQSPELPLKGRDLRAAGMASGPDLGRLLEEVEDWWVENDFAPSHAELLARANHLAGSRDR